MKNQIDLFAKVAEPQDVKSPNSSVIFINDTPTNWGAVIIQAGATFRFQAYDGSPDGTDVVQQPCNVPAGGSFTVVSRVNKCCRSTFVAMLVQVPGQQPQIISGELSDSGTANQCLISCKCILSPKQSLARSGGSLFEIVAK